MTLSEIIPKIDGTTKGQIIEQAYDLGFKDGYETMSLVAMGETSSKMVIKNMLEDDNICFLNKITNGEDTNSSDIKIDNKPNPPMPKDYDKFTFDPQLAEEYTRKAADISGISLEEFMKSNSVASLKIFNYPKHVIVNGALYELIDESPLTVVSGYHGGV